MVEKALLIKGPLKNLGDVLYIARKEGKALLRTKKVNVKPIVYLYDSDSYLVVVAPMGSSKSPGVGEKGRNK